MRSPHLPRLRRQLGVGAARCLIAAATLVPAASNPANRPLTRLAFKVSTESPVLAGEHCNLSWRPGIVVVASEPLVQDPS
jgi:hypothetical protein